MSKHREHRKSAVGRFVSAPPTATTVIPPAGNAGRSFREVVEPRTLLQVLAIVGLSCALGFTFNAASPVGVRFAEPAAVTTRAKVIAEETPIPAAPVRTNPIAAAPLTPKPVEAPVTPTPPIPPTPQPTSTPLPVLIPQPLAITNAVIASVQSQPASPNPAPIHWPEAKLLAVGKQAVLVDVRPRAMFDAGHIPGAISLPETSSPDEFQTFLGQQAANLTVIVYCSSTSCSQSARVANRLVNEFRWPSVRYMTGGYLEYQQAELANPSPPSVP